jgi:hypothetical protein
VMLAKELAVCILCSNARMPDAPQVLTNDRN